MRQRLASFFILLVVLALAPVSSVRATVIVPLELEELVARSELVVRGVVEASESRRTSSGEQIFTFTRVRVVERFKGEPAQYVEVRTPGGTVGELTQRVAGVPALVEGDEVILLLRRVHPEHAIHLIVGFSQGCFRLVTDPRLGRAVVRPAGPAEFRDGQVAAAPALEPIPEAAFFERLRRAIVGGSQR